jgi:hypothetical protein
LVCDSCSDFTEFAKDSNCYDPKKERKDRRIVFGILVVVTFEWCKADSSFANRNRDTARKYPKHADRFERANAVYRRPLYGVDGRVRTVGHSEFSSVKYGHLRVAVGTNTQHLKEGVAMRYYFLALGALVVVCMGCAGYGGHGGLGRPAVLLGLLHNNEYVAPPAAMMQHPGPMVDGPGPGVLGMLAQPGGYR